MTIKEYLKDHSERELWEKIIHNANCSIINKSVDNNSGYWKIDDKNLEGLLELENIKIEEENNIVNYIAGEKIDEGDAVYLNNGRLYKVEEDYLAKAREMRTYWVKNNGVFKEPGMTVFNEHDIFDMYEDAIKQLQEKK
jgi:hypothetical protein